MADLKAARPAVNAAVLVGHTTLRQQAMADLGRSADAGEVARMRAALQEALDAGAIGLSTGVYYPAGARADSTQELIDVAEPLRDGAGLITMHIRDEGDAIDDALREALAVGRAVNAPLVLSHHKLMGRGQPRAVDAARWRWSRPRRASSPSAWTVIPTSRRRRCCCRRAWRCPATCASPGRRWNPPPPAGRCFTMAAERGIDPTTLATQLVPGGAIYFAMSDEDVDRILAHPLVMIGSDGLPHDPVPHPRLWGTFPRVLGHYVRQRRLLALEAPSTR
jgi:N-acyl-D-amino-acid deacylase